MSEPSDEGIDLPDGSTLPPGYEPGDMENPEPEPTPPPEGETWEEYSDWTEGL